MSDLPERFSTGDANLDLVLGGGLLRGSATLLTGPPGAGKSLLSHQIAMTNATEDRPVLHISTFTETQAKVVRNLRGLAFFDEDRFGRDVIPITLSDVLFHDDRLEAFVEEVTDEVLRLAPAITIIDSVRAVSQIDRLEGVREALYRLVAQLSHTGTSLLLVGEYPQRVSDRPEYAVSDTIIWLDTKLEGAGDHRTLHVVKHRGSDHVAGQHSMEITSAGVTVHPRLESVVPVAEVPASPDRASLGLDGLDEYLGGGLPVGEATLVLGASGTGKTVLASHFAAAGLAVGDPVIYLALEESPAALEAKWDSFGLPLGEARRDGRLEVLHAPVAELDIDAVGQRLRRTIERVGACRIVVDSIGPLRAWSHQAGRHPGYLWALANLARSTESSVLFLQEIPIVDALTSDEGISQLFSNVLLLRFIEDDARLGRALTVLKMRDSAHTGRLVRLDIDDQGMHVGGVVEELASGLLGWTALRSGGD